MYTLKPSRWEAKEGGGGSGKAQCLSAPHALGVWRAAYSTTPLTQKSHPEATMSSFTHLTILYSRHFEYDKLADEVTKTARNAALRSELALFVDHHMAASGHCAQFNSILVRSAKSCNSLSINRCSHNKIQLTPCTFSHTYRIDSAVIDYRHRSGNVQVLLI
jgi:hypothetical protein